VEVLMRGLPGCWLWSNDGERSVYGVVERVYLYSMGWQEGRGVVCSVCSVLNRGNVNIGKDSAYSLVQHYGKHREMSYISLKIGLWVSGQLLLSWIPCLFRRKMWYFSRLNMLRYWGCLTTVVQNVELGVSIMMKHKRMCNRRFTL
jgi:hypothetical protein